MLARSLFGAPSAPPPRAVRRILVLIAFAAVVGVLLVPGVALANPPNPTFSKTADNPVVTAGNPIGFTLTFQIRPSTDSLPPCVFVATGQYQCPALNVTVTDTLPSNPGLSWSVDPASSAGCSIAAGVLTCDWGTMADPNETKSVHVTSPTSDGTLAPGTCGTVTNSNAEVSWNQADGTPGSLLASASITVTPSENNPTCATPTPTATPTTPPQPTPTPTATPTEPPQPTPTPTATPTEPPQPTPTPTNPPTNPPTATPTTPPTATPTTPPTATPTATGQVFPATGKPKPTLPVTSTDGSGRGGQSSILLVLLLVAVGSTGLVLATPLPRRIRR